MDFKTVFYENYRSTHSTPLYGPNTPDRRRRQEKEHRWYFGKLLPQDRSAAMLDVGCGDGNFVRFLRSEGYLNTCGIDLSREQIEAGQALGIEGLELADMHHYLQDRENAFDCIVAKDVVEHLTRQEAFDFLLKVRRALKPQGCFLMQVPNAQGLHHAKIFHGDLTHEVAYTLQTVSQIFLNAGFRSAQSYPTGPIPLGLKGRLRSLLWSLKVLQIRFWQLVETGNSAGIFTANLIAKGIK